MISDLNDAPLTDRDILDLIDGFHAWQTDVGVSPNAGLWQMLLFLREAIKSKVSLYARMLERQRAQARQLAKLSIGAPFDVAIAADYLSERLHHQPFEIDYDGAFLVCGLHLSAVADTLKSPQIAATYNTLFDTPVENRLTPYWSFYRGGDPTPEDIQKLEKPVIADILGSGFPIPLYVDSMQMGPGAWGEGAEIAWKIYRHINSARSQGQLCSLYPPDIAAPVDWRRNVWASDPDFLDYLDLSFRGDKPLPDWAREWMRSRAS